MIKHKLTQLKTTIKRQLPGVAVGVVITAALGYFIYVARNDEDEVFPLQITEDDLERLRLEDDNLVFTSPTGETLKVIYTPA
jgi:hypothetical protein